MKMNIKLPYWDGKKWKLRRLKPKKKISRRKSKPEPLTVEQIGKKDGKSLCSLWNFQTNPRKIYIGGNRIHHGLFGLALRIYGILENDDYLKGLGKSFMKDAIKDMPDWFNFKK